MQALLVAAALAVPVNWILDPPASDGDGACQRLVSERGPNAMGMGSNGYATEDPLGEVTEYEGGGYVFPLPITGVAGWFVTAKEGTISQTAAEADTMIDSKAINPAVPDVVCDSFMSYGGPGVDLTAGPSMAVWTPPAGASGTYTIEVASATGFATIMYHSYEITVEGGGGSPSLSPSPPMPMMSPPSPSPVEPCPDNCVCYRRRKILFSSPPECPPECC